MCDILAGEGYWVHFIVPDARGAQPFDIVAAKGGRAAAIDCKTSSTHRFSVTRLEDNQHMAFRRWLDCGNDEPMLAVLWQDKVYMIPYNRIVEEKVVDLKQETWVWSIT